MAHPECVLEVAVASNRRVSAVLVGLLAAGAVLVPASAASALNTPEECARYVGEPEIVDLPEKFADFPVATTFDPTCVVVAQSGIEVLGQADATYEDFLAIVQEISGDAAWELLDGYADTTEITDPAQFAAEPVALAAYGTFLTEGLSFTLSYNAAGDAENFSSFGSIDDPTAPHEISTADGSILTIGTSAQAEPVPEAPSAPAGRTAGLTDPSVLSTLRTLPESVPSVTQGGVIAATSVFLMLVVGYPGSLLSSVVAARYEQLVGAVRRRRGREPVPAGMTKLRWFWIGILAASVISGFVDPLFGFNPLSARVVVTALIAFAVYNVAGWAVVRAVVKRIDPAIQSGVQFRWGSLGILAAAVLLSRIIELQPGIIFGLVAGLTFVGTLALSRRAVVVLVGTGFAAAVGLASWVVFSILAPVADASPGNLLTVTASELFSALTIEGIASLPLALLPFAALDGGVLLSWKRWTWAVAYAAGVALFMLVLVTVPAAFGAPAGDYLRWIVIFAVFAVFATAVWWIDGVLRRRAEKS